MKCPFKMAKIECKNLLKFPQDNAENDVMKAEKYSFISTILPDYMIIWYCIGLLIGHMSTSNT